ncbi:MAG TPA: DUF4192 domain-containing protein [Lapillicoccus sp.]|nr:DUF4192 domain-containing protein [Lapillicoccus sp.]
MTTTIRLRGPADIIAVLPYHLGYRPADSLVVVCLRSNRIGVVGRVDLPPPDIEPHLVAVELLPVVERERPDAVVLVGFEGDVGRAEPASTAMRDALEGAGIRVLDRLVVRDGRWWSLDCDGSCCPPEGEPVPLDESVPAVADYVLRGRRPAASRDGLVERLASRADAEVDTRCAALIHDLATAQRSRSAHQRRRRRIIKCWAEILDLTSGGPDAVPRVPEPGDDTWVWAAVSLLDVQVRDLLIAWLCPGTLDLGVFPASLRRLAEAELPPRSTLLFGRGGDGDPEGVAEAGPADEAVDVADGVVERLAMVCRAAPVELSPGPLTVLAHVAWWLGDGALARTALDLALEVDPDYRLAALLERMVDVALRPGVGA